MIQLPKFAPKGAKISGPTKEDWNGLCPGLIFERTLFFFALLLESSHFIPGDASC